MVRGRVGFCFSIVYLLIIARTGKERSFYLDCGVCKPRPISIKIVELIHGRISSIKGHIIVQSNRLESNIIRRTIIEIQDSTELACSPQ